MKTLFMQDVKIRDGFLSCYDRNKSKDYPAELRESPCFYNIGKNTLSVFCLLLLGCFKSLFDIGYDICSIFNSH